MRTLSPSLMSVWSVCRPVSSASWSCHGRGCTNTVWSVGVAPSSAGTVAATLPWGTSLSTTWPAQLLTMTQVLLKLPANHSQTTVRGCRLNRHRHKLQTNFHNITVPILLNYYHACFLFTAKIRVSCDRCKASFPAEDIEEHEVHIFVHIMRPIPETKHKHVLNYKKKIKIMISHKNDWSMELKLRSSVASTIDASRKKKVFSDKPAKPYQLNIQLPSALRSFRESSSSLLSSRRCVSLLRSLIFTVS